MDALTLILIFMVITAFMAFKFLRRHRGYLESQPIPLTKPQSAFLGSPPRDLHNYVIHDFYLRRIKEYGKTFGYYRGGLPVICTVDPQLLKAIYIKNFDNFTDVMEHEIGKKEKTMDLLDGDTWKILRRKLSPTFTSGKIKGMLDPMEEALQKTVDKLELACGSVIDVRPILQDMALVVTCRCAFGVEVDRDSELDQKLLKTARELGQSWALDADGNRDFQLLAHFPILAKFFPFFPEVYYKMWKVTKGILWSLPAS